MYAFSAAIRGLLASANEKPVLAQLTESELVRPRSDTWAGATPGISLPRPRLAGARLRKNLMHHATDQVLEVFLVKL